MGFPPTEEQQAVIDTIAAGKRTVVEAGAGTGKTSTIVKATETIMNKARSRYRILYVVYNKAARVDAQSRLPKGVTCKTVHGLAFWETGKPLAHKMDRDRETGAVRARLLRINEAVKVDDITFQPAGLARIAMQMIKKFCYSADEEIGWWHMPGMPGIDPVARKELGRHLVAYARRAWDDLESPHGGLRLEHDHYLKMFQLKTPRLPYDMIILDEAQDSNKCRTDLITSQGTHALVSAVGDSCQQLYGWQDATNALPGWPADERLWLTQSWRFGQAIADYANLFLAPTGTPLRVRGNPAIRAEVGDHVTGTTAVLCRTNGAAIGEVIRGVEAGLRVGLIGDKVAITEMAETAMAMDAGLPHEHSQLGAFTTWEQVQRYVELEPDGSDLKALVSAVDRYTAPVLIRALRSVDGDQHGKDLVVATGHRSKGLEFSTVRIAEDFPQPTEEGLPSSEELQLAYVAVTRAKQGLNPGSLSYITEQPAKEDDEFSRVLEASSLGTPGARSLRARTSPEDVARVRDIVARAHQA